MKGRGKLILEMVNSGNEDPASIEGDPPAALDMAVRNLTPCMVINSSPSLLDPSLPEQSTSDRLRRVPKRQYVVSSPTHSNNKSDYDDSDADQDYIKPIPKRKIIFSPLPMTSTSSKIPRTRSLSSLSSSSSSSSRSSSSSSSSSNLSSNSLNNERNAIDLNDDVMINHENIQNQNIIPSDNSIAHEEIVQGKKKFRKPETWKALKNSGKLGKEIPARKLQPPCGEKCRLKCTTNLNLVARQKIFDAFWGLSGLQRQREFIVRHTHEIKPKYRYSSTQNYRALNTAFYFENNNLFKFYNYKNTQRLVIRDKD